MGKLLTKNVFLLLQFITALLTCTILGYLFHDLMNGILPGIGVGIGVVIASAIHKS